MTKLSRAAFLTKYNDASTGLYKAGQIEGIGSDDHRTMIQDLEDSVLFLDDFTYELAGTTNLIDSGIWKGQYINAKTTTALPACTLNTSVTPEYLEADANGALPSIDAVSLSVGSSVMVSEEVDTRNNGVYTVTSLGSGASKWKLTRRGDSATGISQFRAIYYVVTGSAYTDTFWRQEGTTDAMTPPVFAYEEFSFGGGASVDEYIVAAANTSQILDAFDTPRELIPAPGAGKYIIPESLVGIIDFNTTPYDTNTTFVIQYGDGTQILVDATNVLATSADRVIKLNFSIVDAVVNQPIEFTVLDGNPLSGDSAISFLITYKTITI